MKPSIFQLYFCSTCWPIQAEVDQMGFLQSILKSSEINISSCFICHINNDRNTGTLHKSSDRTDQSAAYLPKKMPKTMDALMPLKLLITPPHLQQVWVTASNSLTPEEEHEREGRRGEKEEARLCHIIIIHTLESNTRLCLLFVVIH